MESVDGAGEPTPVAPLRPCSPDERRRHAAAEVRKAMRARWRSGSGRCGWGLSETRSLRRAGVGQHLPFTNGRFWGLGHWCGTAACKVGEHDKWGSVSCFLRRLSPLQFHGSGRQGHRSAWPPTPSFDSPSCRPRRNRRKQGARRALAQTRHSVGTQFCSVPAATGGNAQSTPLWIGVTAAPWPSSALSPARSSRCRVSTRCTTCTTGGAWCSDQRRGPGRSPRPRRLRSALPGLSMVVCVALEAARRAAGDLRHRVGGALGVACLEEAQDHHH